MLVISDGSKLRELHDQIVKVASTTVAENPEIKSQIDKMNLFGLTNAVGLTNATMSERLERLKSETIELGILEASITYTSNFGLIGIKVELSGITKPGATVTLYLPDGSTPSFAAGSDGRWMMAVRLEHGKNFIYGKSTDSNFQSVFFRINISTAVQEPVPATRFEELRRTEQ